MKIRCALAFLIAIGTVWGQKGGGPPATSGNPGTGGMPSPGVGRTPTNNNPSTMSPGSTPSAPIFLSGKVAMADGSPVPPGVSIQRICQGTPRTVAYADSHGNFSFQWGQYTGITPDASEPGLSGGSPGLSAQTIGGSTVRNMTSTAGSNASPRGDAMGGSIGACELRASIPGYTSDTVNLFMHRSMDNPDVGRIFLHRNTAVEGTSVSATSLLAPKDARKAYEKGLESLHKGKQADATKDFEKAVDLYPHYADAWVELGRLRAADKATAPAREAFTNALNADGKLVTPYVELGMMAARESNWNDTAGYLDKAVKLDPVDFPGAWYVDAVANFNLKNLDAAEKSAREAVKLDPQHRNPRADYLLGLVLLEKRDYTGASTELKNYLAMSPAAENQAEVRKQLDEIEKLQPQQSTPQQPTPQK